MNDFLRNILISSASATLIAVMLLIGRPFIKNKIPMKFQYYSWLAVFLRFLMIFSVSGIFTISIPSNQNSSASALRTILTASASPQAAKPYNPGNAPAAPTGINPIHQSGLFSDNLWLLVFTVWLAGTLVMIGTHIIGYRRYNAKIKSTRKKADTDTLQLMALCCKQLNLPRSLPVFISSYTDTTMLYGFIKNSIILPEGSFTAEELKHAFSHELVHYKRHDNIMKWISVLSLSLHWFNPMAYWSIREMSRLCELSCDETVVKNFSKEERVQYGKTLLTVASQNGHRPFPLSASMSEGKRNLKERLEVLMKTKKVTKRAMALSGIILSLVAIITAMTVLLTGCKSIAGTAEVQPSSEASSLPAPSSGASSSGTTNSGISSSEAPASVSSDSEASTPKILSSAKPNEKEPIQEVASSPVISPATSNLGSDSLSSMLNDNSTLAEIVNNVDAPWKTRYADITITNAWISAKLEDNSRDIVLCGALKNDPRQGVAETIIIQKNKSSIIVVSEQRYPAPVKHGALKAYALGAKDFGMGLMDKDGLKWNFVFDNGFMPNTPLTD